MTDCMLGILDSRGHICVGISLTQGERQRLLWRSRATELVSYQVKWLIVEVNHIIQKVGGAGYNQAQPFHTVWGRFMA